VMLVSTHCYPCLQIIIWCLM